MMNDNCSKAGAASSAVNINIGDKGAPLSANNMQNSAIDVTFKLQPATKGMTTNSTKGVAKSVLNGNVSASKASPTGGRVAKLPGSYSKVKGA